MSAYFNFSTGTLHAPDGPLSQESVDSIWRIFPTTGCRWVENGHLYVQQYDGAIVYDLGSVQEGAL